MVAETRWACEHVLLDVARSLGVTSAAADRLIKCQVDDKLAASSEVAVGKGLFPRTARAPREARVVAVGRAGIVGSRRIEDRIARRFPRTAI